MRKKRDGTGAWAARARRRRSRALLAEVRLPDPFDLTTFTEQIARQRDRPIQLVAVESAAADGALRGWWCPTHDRDLIFLDQAASGMQREHMVFHEIGHMLWGHDLALATLAPEVEHATAHLRWDNGATTAMLGCSGYDYPREQEAEVFATMVGLRVAASREARPGSE